MIPTFKQNALPLDSALEEQLVLRDDDNCCGGHVVIATAAATRADYCFSSDGGQSRSEESHEVGLRLQEGLDIQ